MSDDRYALRDWESEEAWWAHYGQAPVDEDAWIREMQELHDLASEKGPLPDWMRRRHAA